MKYCPMVGPVDPGLLMKLLAPASRKPLHEEIASQIKELIMSNGIEVGQRLPPERDLAQQFMVSRTVVREALNSLTQSGFILRRTGATGGAFVADNYHLPFFNSVYDLLKGGKLTLAHFYEARQAVECRSASLAARRAKPEDIRRLRELNKRLLELPAEPKYANESSIAFHVAVAEISGNPLIVLIIQSLVGLLVTLYPNLAKPGQAGKELNRQLRVSGSFLRDLYKTHEDIVDAIEAGDQFRSEELMAAHTILSKKIKSRG